MTNEFPVLYNPKIGVEAICISIAEADTEAVDEIDVSAFAIFMDEGLVERSNDGADDVNAIFVLTVVTLAFALILTLRY